MNRDDDDLAFLRAGLKRAPKADPKAKADALSRAMEAFEKTHSAPQESGADTRPSSDRPAKGGVLKGVLGMLNTLKMRPVLTATTSAAALALGLFVMLPALDRGPVTAPLPTGAPVTAADAPALAEAEAPPQAPLKRAKAAPLSDPAPAAMAEPPARALAAAPAPMPEAAMDQLMEPAAMAPASTEAFANAPENPVQMTTDNPVSTFSVDVDTASWAVIRSALNAGHLPPPDAVRVEEMINYFPYGYAPPGDTGLPFRPGIAVMETPWNAHTRLVRIALQGRVPAVANRPPLNLVFLVDTSGSMNEPAKLPLLKQSLGLMLGQLQPEDQIAIVAYAGSAGEVLPPTAAGDRRAILAALDRLDAGGATAGAEGLELAYQVAAGMAAPGEISRVLLATDGDFNLGPADPAELAALVARKRKDGTYLSVLGFGRGNLDDATMQALAQNGNGTASYIDTLQEAQKVLVDQLAGALFPIADDVKIQVEWNPAEVAEYRLIGYETRALRREDFNNDAVDAGEIGAGHQVTALYEITAPGSPALRNDPLRYGARAGGGAAPATTGAELGFLRLRFKTSGDPAAGGGESTLVETPITADAGPDTDARFAAAIAGFGQLLRGSDYLGNWGWDDAVALAQENRGDDPFGYRSEAVMLMRLARSLSQ